VSSSLSKSRIIFPLSSSCLKQTANESIFRIMATSSFSSATESGVMNNNNVDRTEGSSSNNVAAMTEKNRGSSYAVEKDGSRISSNENEERKLKKSEKNNKITSDSLTKLFQFARPEWPLIGAATATLSITSSVTLVLPYASGRVIDASMTGDAAASSPMLMAGGLFTLVLFSSGGVYLRNLWLARAGNRIVARLRRRTYRRLLLSGLPRLERISTGDILSRLSSDAQLVQSAVTTQSVAALRATVMSAVSAGMVLHTSPTLALLSLSTLPPVFAYARYAGRKLRERQNHVQELHASANSLASEALMGIETVKRFNSEDVESERYGGKIAQAHTAALETSKDQAGLEAFTHAAINGGVLAVLGYGGVLVNDGVMSAGDLTGFLMYSLLLAGNLSSFAGIYADLSRAVAASDRVMDLTNDVEGKDNDNNIGNEDPLLPAENWNSKSPTMNVTTDESVEYSDSRAHDEHSSPLSIRIENLTFAYPSHPDTPVLNNLSLEIDAGTSVAIVGGSGSGKSTVALLLSRLYDPPRGTVFVGGIDVHDGWDVSDLRRKVGVVSQDPVLFGDMTIADNIRYGRWHDRSVSERDILRAADLGHVSEFANGLPGGIAGSRVRGSGGGGGGMGNDGGENGHEYDALPLPKKLSGGQRQRVAIARTLLWDPSIIVLDEATSALDGRSEEQVQRAMEHVTKSKKTVLSIAHRLSTVRQCDSILVMEGGRIVQSGTFDELSRDVKGPFWDLMKTQLIHER